jgi:hypothetical protein
MSLGKAQKFRGLGKDRQVKLNIEMLQPPKSPKGGL